MYPPDGPPVLHPNTSESSDDAIAGILNVLAIIAAIFLLRQAWVVGTQVLMLEIAGVRVYVGLAFIGAILLAAALMDHLRELRYWKSVAIIQIAVATMAALFGFFATVDLIARCVTLLASIFTIANGMTKYRDISRKKLEKLSALAKDASSSSM